MRGSRILAGVVALAVTAWAAWRLARPAPESPEPGVRLSLLETLAGTDTAGFRRALEPRPFRFPQDHGPHPDFRNEWWYFTGNLDGPGGRRFGFQLTVFRSALAPSPPDLPSSWATNQVFMGHLAVTDAAAGTFRAFERFGRGAVGIAGAEAQPFRVWVDDWSVRGPGGGEDTGVWPMTLEAADGGTGIRLIARPSGPPVAQGERGLSRKGPQPGNASYYYSFPRLALEGIVRVGGREVPVTGEGWLDREWSTSALSAGQVGWDWFALQLSDGRELMVYRLRRSDRATDPFSAGMLVDGEGDGTRLAADAFDVTATGSWTSPVDGATYPSGWRVEVPGLGLALNVQPVLRDQELTLSFRYWEGAVDVTGTSRGSPVRGRGYVELTGYAGAEAPGMGSEGSR